MRIYTKTGDRGETGLFGGRRIGKGSARIAAIGDVDELNACLGLCRAARPPDSLDQEIARLQSALFDVGASLATPGSATRGLEDMARQLEASMDAQADALPPLRNFILPGGTELAARLHAARAVCRRAERTLVALHAEDQIQADILVMINRLSDWLFLAARTANAASDVKDVVWSSRPED